MKAPRITFRPDDRDRELLAAILRDQPWLSLTAAVRYALEVAAGEKVKKKR